MIKTPSKARAQAAHAGPVTGGAFTPPRPAAAKSGTPTLMVLRRNPARVAVVCSRPHA